jgi:tRNA-2-methylthio-N6-dimethylallyladenosine synthase
MTSPQKSVYFKTYGCQMNVYDSDRMRGSLAGLGYAETTTPEGADLVIFNTCHIREHAVEKVYSELGRMRKMKQRKRDGGGRMLVAVAGCVAQAEGAEIIRRAGTVDLVFGPQTYHRLPQLIEQFEATQKPVVETEFPAEDKFEALERQRGQIVSPRQVSAFVTVQEGCDKFCTFCVVPYTRGSEFSRPVQQIETEVRKLAAQGVREVTLLGQNVNAYHGQDSAGKNVSLAGLIAQLSQIDGIERLRYMTSHPRDMSEDLYEAHAGNQKLMPFLHLPVQSGSNRILKAMNRGHSVEAYIDIIARLRKLKPDMAISGDFIVGFPGETEEDFVDTLQLIQTIGYASAYSFKYSPRPGTPAAASQDQVDDDVMADRLARLQALIHRQQTQFNTACAGKTLPVLMEKHAKFPGQLVGRSPYLQPVHVNGAADHIGTIRNVHISSIGTNSLSGHYENSRAQA